MCFSKEASIIALIVGIIGSILVYTLGTITDKIIGLYLGYVSLMQGIEFILWNHQTCDSFHKNISFLGMLLNESQPIVLGLIILLVNTKLKHKFPIIAIMTVYIGFIAQYMQYSDNLRCTKPRANDPHLAWNWTLVKYRILWVVYIITLVLLSIFGMPTLFVGVVCALFLALTMLLSIIIYPRQVMGTMWCFFAALSPVVYYFSRIQKIISIENSNLIKLKYH